MKKFKDCRDLLSRILGKDMARFRAGAEIVKVLLLFVKTHLDEREAHVITQRFGLSGTSSTLEDIGLKMHGVTRERIRQLEIRALNKIANAAEKSNFKAIFSLKHSKLLKEIQNLLDEKKNFDGKFFHTDFDNRGLALEKIPLEWLRLSEITLNCLRRAGIIFVGQLLGKSEKDLLQLKGLGVRILTEIKKALLKKGLKLKNGRKT